MYYSNYSELKQAFEEMIISKSSDLGLDYNEILNGTHKAEPPYITIKYRPANDSKIYGGVKYHKMSILLCIAVGYSRNNDTLIEALNKAGVIEYACLENEAFIYDTHEEGISIDVLDNKKQTTYYLIVECFAYYRNTRK